MEMATISRKSFLVIFLAAVCCNCQSNGPDGSSSWAKLQISPDTLSSMEYGNFLIEIYEHANNHKVTTTASEKKYFYSPLALLDHTSAVSRLNRVTRQSEMRFRIEMWNDKVQNEVVKHLNEIVGHQIKSNKVTVIPLEKVILASKRPTVDYSLHPEWSIYDKSKTLRLSLTCYDQKICDELANEMRTDPEQFDHFKLLYSLSSQTSQTKQTTISIDSVTSGQMVTTLLQKFGDAEIFLTASDEKKMLTEMATNVRIDTFDDSEVGSPDTESQIFNILKDLLVTSRTTIKEQSDKMWDSVFWNEDNYRPDKTTKTLNEIISKLDLDNQKKLAGMFQKAEKQSEITEKLTSGNKDAEKRREEQLRHENQSKDANLNEMKRSQSTDQEQSSRNQTRNDKSNTNRIGTEVTAGGFLGVHTGAKIAVENINTHNSEQENGKWEIAKKSSNEHNRNFESKENIRHNYDSNSWSDVERISSTISEKLTNNFDSSNQVGILNENVEKFLQESRNHVQWDGEKFMPKPMQLSRINLGKFRDSQMFQDRNIRVRYTNAELSAPIKFMEHADLIVTDEWNNLKEELKDTSELLNTALVNLKKRSTDELDKTRIDLTIKLEGINQEFVKTKIELRKTTADLRQTVDNLTVKLNLAEKELTDMNISAGNLSTELKATLSHLEATTTNLASTRTELNSTKFAIADLTTKLNVAQMKMEATKVALDSTRIELSDTNSTVSDLWNKLNARTSEMADIGQMPTSCEDLHRMGQQISGIFLVKGSKKMEMVYCNFVTKNKQKWIGYADVKSHPVHFYVMRNSTFETNGSPIPFDLAWVNEGNAMNLTSGVFTAPRKGTYFFFFTGVATFPVSAGRVQLGLYLNGGEIGKGVIEKSNVLLRQWSLVSLQSTLNLKSGDQVWVQIDHITSWSYMYDSSDHLTHFTGFMLDEEIVESL